MNTKSSLYVVHVAPIVKGFTSGSASYFSTLPYTEGSIVSVPFRKREIQGIVLSSTPLSKERSSIKRADFGLKKIKKQKAVSFLHPRVLRAVHKLTETHPTTPGEILSLIIPKALLSHIEELPEQTETHEPTSTGSVLYVQKAMSDRIDYYVKKSKESLSEGRSSILLVPSGDDAASFSKKLSEECGKDTVRELSSRLTSKKQVERWKEIITSEKPLIVVMTAGYISLPIKNIGTVLTDSPSSPAYTYKSRPFLNAALIFEKIYASYDKIKADTYISVADDKGERSLDSVNLRGTPMLVDMTEENEGRTSSSYKVISNKLLNTTKHYLNSGKRAAWFVPRRGLFPQTVCSDCGYEHTCSTCDSSLVLHENKQTGTRFFLCHRCGEKEPARTLCKHCGSWRLTPLGVGIDSVSKQAQDIFENVFVVSSDSTKAVLRKTLKAYEETPGALLIGTDVLLSYSGHVDFIGIISIDSRIGIPSFNAEEHALRTLLSLASLASEAYLVQTRRKDNRIFKHLDGKHLNTFRNEELALREQFSYPPFGTLVEVAFSATKERAEERLLRLSKDIETHLTADDSLTIQPLKKLPKKNKYRAGIVLKIKGDLRSHKNLLSFLLFLSPDIYIRVNPDSLW